MNEEIKEGMREVLFQLAELAGFCGGDLLVIGCSTSEVLGRPIGSASNLEVAEIIVDEVLSFCRPRQIEPAFQCCEHLNRALVLESTRARAGNFSEVNVLPRPEAGGALAAVAMEKLLVPVVVEDIGAQARGGIDIGSTLIGMHLCPVAVPVRLPRKTIGKALVTCARTRPRLIGGSRAVYRDW